MRPIDADKVMEEINRIGGHNLCEWETLGVKALICRQDTIDVVPREELDRLRHILNSYALQYGTATDKEVFLKQERAATVRKMQEAIKERCIKGGIYPAFVKNVVEAVAKELLEDVTPANLVSFGDVSKAIKDYCCDLIDAGKDMVEVTEFNADLQKILKSYIGDKTNGTP